MHRFQKISFRDFNDFYDYIPAEEQVLVDLLWRIIYETLPDVRERLAYNVPFYYRHRRICYLWPSSIPWGGLKPNSGVALGFVKGRQFAADYLTGGTGRDMRYRTFSHQKEVDAMLLRDLLLQAAVLDNPG